MAVLIGLGQGCAGGAGSSAGPELSDSAGVRVVLNHAPAEAGPFQLRETLRIGGGAGDGPDHFSGVAALAVDAWDTLFVGNTGSGSIRVFSPEGRFIREIGARGVGAGELRSITSVFPVGDTVAVLGAGSFPKTVLYSRDGALLEDWNVVRTTGLTLAPIAFLRSGWIGTTNEQSLWRQEWVPGTDASFRRDLRELRPGEDVQGPVFLSLPPSVLRVDRNGAPHSGLFRINPELGVDGSGRIYSVLENRYRVDVFAPDGRHVMAVLREHDPVPLRDRDMEELLALHTTRWDTATDLHGRDRATLRRMGEAALREAAELTPFDALSPVRRLRVANAGGFWAERVDHLPAAGLDWERQTARTGPNGMYVLDRPTLWDVYDRDGALLKTVELPPRFTPMLVTDSSVAGVLHEAGTEFVVSFRIEELPDSQS